MKLLNDNQRNYIVMKIARSQSEDLLLNTQLVNYLAIGEDQQEIANSVAEEIISMCNAYHPNADTETLTSGIALALFSIASDLEMPVINGLH